jgi:hypothetical protein
MHAIFCLENLKGRDHSEDLGVNGNLREIRCEGVDWMRLAQDRDQWRSVVNTIVNLWVP